MCNITIRIPAKILFFIQVDDVPTAASSESDTPSPPSGILAPSPQQPQQGEFSGNTGFEEHHQEHGSDSVPPTPQGEATCSDAGPNAHNQLTSWSMDIFASDRNDILQKSSRSSVKPECNGINSISSHFPPLQQHSEGPTERWGNTSDSNSVQCREHCLGGWSMALGLSFASSTSRCQSRIDISGDSSPLYQYRDQYTDMGLTAVLNPSFPSNSRWMTDVSIPCQQQREHYPAETLSAALNLTFASSPYNAIPFCGNNLQQTLQFSDEAFRQESGLLQYMGMLVPLDSLEVATCSKSGTFEYTALHIRDPSLDNIPLALDYKLPSPKLKDLNDGSVPKHVRKGINYEEKDLVDFQPEVYKLKKHAGIVHNDIAFLLV